MLQKNPVKLLRPWHQSYDLALLVNVYKFGHKRSMSSMDTIFRDPESPFYHAVVSLFILMLSMGAC